MLQRFHNFPLSMSHCRTTTGVTIWPRNSANKWSRL